MTQGETETLHEPGRTYHYEAQKQFYCRCGLSFHTEAGSQEFRRFSEAIILLVLRNKDEQSGFDKLRVSIDPGTAWAYRITDISGSAIDDDDDDAEMPF